MDLFGFSTVTELDAFKMLITFQESVQRQPLLFCLSLRLTGLRFAIASSDTKSIIKANGIGRKTAERIVLELKDKMANVASGDILLRLLLQAPLLRKVLRQRL